MAVSWLTQFAIVILNVLLGILFVLANKDFCGSVFETRVEHALVGHVIRTTVVVDEFECQLKCMGNNSCMSINVHPGDSNGKRCCELNNTTRQMKPGHFKKKKGSTYYSSVQASCMDVSRGRKQTTESGQCHPRYKGKHCETPTRGLYYDQPGHSCKEIRDSGFFQKDGEYWIDPEKNGKPLKVYCDMTTDGGGWLLVSNVVVDDPSSRQLSIESSYREISNCHDNKTLFITKDAMKELRTHLSFTQLRFHCSKQKGRTIHVTTAANSSGEAVVQYFSGQTDSRPLSCGSFNRMENDNSRATASCHQWYDMKWGSLYDTRERLNDHLFYVPGHYHWVLTDGNQRWECDDHLQSGSEFFALSSDDFWKVFVR
ncbi:uncharacterized protein [Pocillopora verrucosa]|uniref:uncharacterized protein n=1 Tax=Pocillopora verrucosa TaxID=203993 RepID=UPI00333E8437